MKKKIAILGSTGSIGKYTLEVINKDKKNFDIVLLTANNNYRKLIQQAKQFQAKNVLIKGGHLKSKIMLDIFVNKNEISIFKNNKFSTSNTHGTGCTLSSAIATFFGCGKTLRNLVRRALSM